MALILHDVFNDCVDRINKKDIDTDSGILKKSLYYLLGVFSEGGIITGYQSFENIKTGEIVKSFFVDCKKNGIDIFKGEWKLLPPAPYFVAGSYHYESNIPTLDSENTAFELDRMENIRAEEDREHKEYAAGVNSGEIV